MKKVISFIAPILLIVSCRRSYIVIDTPSVFAITATSAIVRGNITDDGGHPITSRGMFYNPVNTPRDVKVVYAMEGGTGEFDLSLSGLMPNTTYHALVHASNSDGLVGAQINFTTLGVCTPDNTMTDCDGNTYCTKQIGNQVWMIENLRTTKYCDDDHSSITFHGEISSWRDDETGPAYTFYEGDENNKNVYGCLYNWAAISHPHFAPDGWRVPTREDWEELKGYLDRLPDPLNTAGSRLKEAGTITQGGGHWKDPPQGSTPVGNNKSGFKGLPGGRTVPNNAFGELTKFGYWWSSTEIRNSAFYLDLRYHQEQAYVSSGFDKKSGLSVRLIKILPK